MGQRAHMHGHAPNPPVSKRAGATVEPVLIRTPDEAEQVWPLAEAILPTRTIERLNRQDQRSLLVALSNNPTLAYRCLRWARWMSSNRKLQVICLKCQCTKVWSDSVVSQYRLGGTCYIDEGKWRWLCPKDRHKEKGCGGRFYDTTETPFCYARVPPGFVFAALAYPSGVIQRLLKEGQQRTDLSGLCAVLDELKQPRHQRLRERLRQYARLFCGTVLLRDCAKLTRSFDGVKALEARLQLLHGTGPVAQEYDASAILQRKESFGQLGELVKSLHHIDKDSPRGQASQRLDRRKKLWEDLQDVVQTIREPVHSAPLNLPALLAEAPLPFPKRTR